MITVWVLLAIGAAALSSWVLSRATAAPAARGVSVSARFAQARLIAAESAGAAESVGAAESAGRRPCEQSLHGTRGEPRRHHPRSYVAHCDSGTALGLRHTPRP